MEMGRLGRRDEDWEGKGGYNGDNNSVYTSLTVV